MVGSFLQKPMPCVMNSNCSGKGNPMWVLKKDHYFVSRWPSSYTLDIKHAKTYDTEELALRGASFKDELPVFIVGGGAK